MACVLLRGGGSCNNSSLIWMGIPKRLMNILDEGIERRYGMVSGMYRYGQCVVASKILKGWMVSIVSRCHVQSPYL